MQSLVAEKVWTYRGRDEDEQGVAINTHGLQEGVAPHVALRASPPRQEPPSAQGHQRGVHEDDYRCYGYWKQNTSYLTSSQVSPTIITGVTVPPKVYS